MFTDKNTEQNGSAGKDPRSNLEYDWTHIVE
jgi:hypothetical protein